MASIRQGEECERLFDEAAARPPSERQAFLERACRDEVLREEVASLLQAEEQAGDFLSQSALGGHLPLDGDLVTIPQPGRMVGCYELRAKIGQGGMSTVFLASRADDRYRRRVAVKLVPLAMASAEHLRRFHTERHILASLDHPSIARLHDAGSSEEGLPYFVMEYIEGEPIDAYCDRHRLSIRERLELFRKVCSAVQYAHRNLVVHRDLKPSNILVTEAGEPKLLDFGIAKLLNPELASPILQPTLTWHRVLTPDYASPEQIRGKTITTASDVYSLGVLLYKLLTGHLPHRLSGRTPQEIERLVTAVEPELPSTAVRRIEDGGNGAGTTVETVSRTCRLRPAELRRRLSGDLDNILMMALRSEPQRRYSSAEQLSEDLRRYLADLPVMARKGTLAYRCHRFLRRNRLPVAVAAAFLLLVLGFATTVAFQASRIARERDQARQEAETSDRVLSFVKRVFQFANPTEVRGQEVTLREVLDRGSDKVVEELQDQPEIRASLQNTMGEIYLNLGLYDKAESLLNAALSTRREVLGEAHPDVAEGLVNLGVAHHMKGDYGAAEELYREALARARRLFGEKHPGVLEPINKLVAVLGDKGEYEEAEKLARQALSLSEHLLDDSDPEVMNALQNLAGLLYAQGDYAGTAELSRRAVALHREHLGVEHPDTAFTLGRLAVVIYRQGDHEEAQRTYEEALAIQRKALGSEHPEVLRTLNNLAVLLRDRGLREEAERIFREVLDLRTRSLGRDHPDVVYTLRGLASLLIEDGSPEEAEPLIREGLAIWRGKLSADDWKIADLESLLGECLTALGRHGEAEVLLTASYPRLEAQLGADDPQTRKALSRLVEHYRASGEPRKAAELGTG